MRRRIKPAIQRLKTDAPVVRKKNKGNEESNGTSGLFLGIIVIALVFGIPLIMENVIYRNAESAWSEVSSQTISSAEHVRFFGSVSSVITESTTGYDIGAIRVSGFGALIYFSNSKDVKTGDTVIVDGYYHGVSGAGTSVGVVTGASYGSVVTPADVSKTWWNGPIWSTALAIGIIIAVIGLGLIMIDFVGRKDEPATDIKSQDCKSLHKEYKESDLNPIQRKIKK